jgi:hypothetical protein
MSGKYEHSKTQNDDFLENSREDFDYISIT